MSAQLFFGTMDPAKEFEQFWQVYPRRVGKGAARKAWLKARLKVGLTEVLAAVEQHKRTQQWVKDGGQFIPHPSTWLNQERWADEVFVDRKGVHLERQPETQVSDADAERLAREARDLGLPL